MPRLNVVDPAAATGRAKEIFEGPLKGKHFNIFKGMANAPATLDAYLAMSGALKDASLSAKEQEVVQLAVAQANGCEYCQSAHTAIGKGAGLSDAQTVAARRGKIEGDAKLDALARFASAVFEKRGLVSDDDLKKFQSVGYTDQSVAEVSAVYALAIFTNTFNHINQTAVDFPTPPAI